MVGAAPLAVVIFCLRAPAVQADANTAIPAAPSSALVVFLPSQPGRRSPAQDGALERELQSIPGLSVAILSSRQGGYTQRRMVHDILAAARLADRGDSRRRRLQLVALPIESTALPRLRALAARRGPRELLLAVQVGQKPLGHELVWSAAAGLPGGSGQTLSSQTTEQRGLIAAIDVAPTLLAHLRLPIPSSLHGRQIHTDGALDGAWLRSLKARLEVLYPRRLPALGCLLAMCALLALLAWVAPTPTRRGSPHASERRRGRVRRALRVDALALLFAPTAMLLPAALEPAAAGEYALIVGVSFALAALAEALVPWPRAPLAPALAAVLAFSIDALAGSQLLIRSLLGPNPGYGSRFYGIGNELKSALAVLVFAAAAAALYRGPNPPTRSRRAAASMAGAGALLAAVEGWVRIGAGVGGVILVCAGAAVATVLLLPGHVRRGRLLAAAAAAPLLGLALLAVLDLLTAGGAGHFTGSVLDAHSLGELWRLIEGRYEAAWEELGNGLMPLATALALLAALIGVRNRERLLAPVAGDPAWLAGLAGGLTAGVVGTLCEDSGPLLLVSAVSALTCVIAYLQAAPSALDMG